MDRVAIIMASDSQVKLTEGPKEHYMPILNIPKSSDALGVAIKALGNPSGLHYKAKCVGRITDTSANTLYVYVLRWKGKSKDKGMHTADQVKQLIQEKKVQEESRSVLETLWRQIWLNE
jgi:hypothetical protein